MPIRVAPSSVPQYLAPPPDWSGLTMKWTGWDKSEWVLTDRTSGVQVAAGLRGLNMVTPERYTSTSASLAGSFYRGNRTPEREVFWPLGVYSDAGSQAWLDYDAAFWSTMHPDRPGVWSVTQPNGMTRTLTCRFVDDGSQSFDYDPSVIGWQAYGVTLVAEQPYWSGDPVTQSWSNEGLAPFLGGTSGSGLGPPFHISRGNTIGSARMLNPGSVDAYPVWTITGPTSSVTVGVGSATITYTAPILAGQSVTIDTNPDRRTVLDQDGISRLANLGPVVSFEGGKLPANAETPLSLALTGTGSVSATIVPRYFRAWGL